MGGWLVSKKEQRWSYKSNSFAATVNGKVVMKSWKRMKGVISHLWKGEYTVSCLVERILGIWNLKAISPADADLLTNWQRNMTDLEQMWIVTPNLLMEKSDLVTRALISNLQRNVRYLYFVKSENDACKWQQIVKMLLAQPQYKDQNLEDLLSAVILNYLPESAEYNLAIKQSGNEGYCINCLQQGEVFQCQRMQTDEVEKVHDSLNMLMQSQVGHILKVRLPSPLPLAELVNIRAKMEQSAKKHGGAFSQTSQDEYEFVFLCVDPEEHANKCYQDLVNFPVIKDGRGKVAIYPDPGYMLKVMRVKGFEFVGPIVNNLEKDFDMLSINQNPKKKFFGIF